VTEKGNRLSWNLAQPVQYFEVERLLYERGTFTTVGKVYATNNTTTAYNFTDTSLHSGPVLYRIKAVMQNGSSQYSNRIRLQRDQYIATVYPNPVHNSFVVSIAGNTNCNYSIELHNATGQLVFMRELQQVTNLQQRIERPKAAPSGMYLLKITNRSTGAISHHKLLFD
jgi:hypothetical protein